MPVDAKPAKRIRDREVVANFAARASSCALCGADRPLDAHHILPKGRGGDDVAANLVALCRSCHDDVECYREDARWMLGEYLYRRRPDTLGYLAHKLGARASVSFLVRSYGG